MEEKTKVKVVLDFPVEITQADGSVITYKELEFGRLKNKHLKLLPKEFTKTGKIALGDMPVLVAAIAGIPESVADEIDITDMDQISKAIESFFPAPQNTKAGSD
jgi:hypothetical protein